MSGTALLAVLAAALALSLPTGAAPARSSIEFRQPSWGFSIGVASSNQKRWPAIPHFGDDGSGGDRSGATRQVKPSHQVIFVDPTSEVPTRPKSRPSSSSADDRHALSSEPANVEQDSADLQHSAPKADPVTSAQAGSAQQPPGKADAAGVGSHGDVQLAQASDQASSSTVSTSDTIFFLDSEKFVSSKNDDFVPECDGIPYTARNSDTGECQFLMSMRGCSKGELFLLNRETLEPSCQPRQCENGEVLFENKCQPESDICPSGMEPLVNEYGEILCDCAVSHVFWPQRNRCYPAFRQGPCPVGKYLTVVNSTGTCTNNECVLDGVVFWPPARRCVRLQVPEDSPCEYSQLDVNQETMKLECVSTEVQAIFDLPAVRCSSGSKLDYGGKCRPKLYQKFRSTLNVVQRKDGGRKKCPPGKVKAPSGRCLKATKTE